MQRLIGQRLLMMLPLMIGMTLISFVVSHALPADPVGANLGQRSMEDPTIVAAFRAQWGLDQPLPQQYLTYIRNLLRQLASGNGSTRGALTGAILRDVRVPLPPIDEQVEIVEIVDAIDQPYTTGLLDTDGDDLEDDGWGYDEDPTW